MDILVLRECSRRLFLGRPSMKKKLNADITRISPLQVPKKSQGTSGSTLPTVRASFVFSPWTTMANISSQQPLSSQKTTTLLLGSLHFWMTHRLRKAPRKRNGSRSLPLHGSSFRKSSNFSRLAMESQSLLPCAHASAAPFRLARLQPLAVKSLLPGRERPERRPKRRRKLPKLC